MFSENSTHFLFHLLPARIGYFLTVFLFVFSFSSSHAQTNDTLIIPLDPVHLHRLQVHDTLIIPLSALDPELTAPQKKHPRLIAAILCLTLGPFGVHRLYLGTDPVVPVAYTLTLGGGLGLLTITDLVLICFSKDITPYMNNPHFFMWNKPGEE